MSLTGDFDALKRLERNMAELAQSSGPTQRQLARGVIGEVRNLLREQFTNGTGPDGSPLTPTVSGEPALVSRKLPQAITGSPVDGGAAMSLRIEWLEAHQHGHTFPPRQVAASAANVRNGRFVRVGKKASAIRGIRAHVIGPRVLPARPIVPEDGLPQRWVEGVSRGAGVALKAWHEKALSK